MIVVFKSKAAGDVIMFGEDAHRLMRIMGKDADPKGIITPEQLPDAITALQEAMIREKGKAGKDDEDDKPALERRVTLAQRATPLLELLERSLKKNTPVVWGV